MQKNFFNLQTDKNDYAQFWYNLTTKKLLDFTRIDIESYEV